MAKLLEVRVRPVTRYIVTRYTGHEFGGKVAAQSEVIGEFDNENRANEVATAICSASTHNTIDQYGNYAWYQPD